MVAGGRWYPDGPRPGVVQQAVKIVLEPIFEADFLCDTSYGFRPETVADSGDGAASRRVHPGGVWVVAGRYP